MIELFKYADHIALLLWLGAAGGFLSGLLGVGGGILFVPGLYYSLSSLGLVPENAMHVALGTSMAIVLVTGSTSALAHAKQQSVDKDIVRSWAPWIVLGVVLGAVLAALIEGPLLKRIFATGLFLLAPYMALGGNNSAAEGGPQHSFSSQTQRILCATVGALSSMLGVGGAILNVPMMTYLGHAMHKAIGTSAALGVVISLPATASYILTGILSGDSLPPFSVGYVNLLALGIIIPTAVYMAPKGVQVSARLSRLTLRRIFAGVLLIVSLRMMLT